MSTPNLELIRAEANQAISPIVTAARDLVIGDAREYGLADAFLAKIRAARKSDVMTKLRKIIDPIRAGLDELYAVERGIKEPLDEAEKQIKGKMRAWQLAEQERVRQEEETKRKEQEHQQREAMRAQLEQERLQREREEAERKAEGARSAAAKRKAYEEAARLQDEQDRAAEIQEKARALAAAAAFKPVEAPTRAASSNVRRIQKWRITDMAKLATAVGAGTVPEAVLQVNSVQLNLLFKNSHEQVAAWPGIEVYEDVEIAGR